MSKCLNKEQAIDYIVAEFKLLPFQEQIIREMWRTKSYLRPVRGSGWSSTQALLTVIDMLLDKEKEKKTNEIKRNN